MGLHLMATWSVVLPGGDLHTVQAANYVAAIGLALARTKRTPPYGSLCFEKLNDTDCLARDVCTGTLFRAHRSARIVRAVYRSRAVLAQRAA